MGAPWWADGSLNGTVATASGFQNASSDGVAPQLSSWGSLNTPHPHQYLSPADLLSTRRFFMHSGPSMTLGTFGASVVGRPRPKTIHAICPALLPPDALIYETPSSLDRVSGGCWCVDLHRMRPSAGDSAETEEARPNCMHWLGTAASRDARADSTHCEPGSETTCGDDGRNSRCDILGRASRCAYCVGLRSPCSNVDAAPDVPWYGTRHETTEGMVNFDGALKSARSNVNAHSCRRCRKRRQPGGTFRTVELILSHAFRPRILGQVEEALRI